MKLRLTCLFLLVAACVADLLAAKNNEKKPRIVSGKQRRYVAGDLKAHHDRMRKIHKNYLPDYPDAPILTTVSVGTPPVDYEVAMESGSEALFLLSKDYPGRTANQPFYDPAQSSTSKYAGRYVGFSGDLGGFGANYDDVVGLFGFAENTTQRLGVVDDVLDPFYIYPTLPDGVLGLSWNPNDADSPNENSSAILNFFKEWQGLNRYWCEWLEDASTSESGRHHNVFVSFGSHLDDRCEPLKPEQTYRLVWFDAMQALAFFVSSLTYKGQQFDGGYAKVDSGVPTILLPDDAFYAVVDDVQPTFDFDYAIYTVDCSKAGNLPDWTFTIGSTNYTIPSTAYVIDLYLPNGQCALSAYLSDWMSSGYVFGYVFHDLWCITMDIDNQTIGLSKALAGPSNASA